MAWLWIFFFSELGIVVGRGLLPQKALATEGGQSHSIRRPGCPAAVCMYVCWLVVLLGIIGRHDKELFGRFIVPQGINVGHVLGRQFNVIRF